MFLQSHDVYYGFRTLRDDIAPQHRWQGKSMSIFSFFYIFIDSCFLHCMIFHLDKKRVHQYVSFYIIFISF